MTARVCSLRFPSVVSIDTGITEFIEAYLRNSSPFLVKGPKFSPAMTSPRPCSAPIRAVNSRPSVRLLITIDPSCNGYIHKGQYPLQRSFQFIVHTSNSERERVTLCSVVHIRTILISGKLPFHNTRESLWTLIHACYVWYRFPFMYL